jgi:hypothetical protein
VVHLGADSDPGGPDTSSRFKHPSSLVITGEALKSVRNTKKLEIDLVGFDLCLGAFDHRSTIAPTNPSAPAKKT